MTLKEIFRLLVIIPWVVFLVYWLIGAIKTRATRQQESFASRYTVLLIETVGYVLLFRNSSGIGFLGSRVVPRNLVGPIVGSIYIWMGIGLAIWARYHLAAYWSARGHDQRGPSTHPQWTVCAPAPSNLYRLDPCGDWLCDGHRQVAMRPGSVPGSGGILL